MYDTRRQSCLRSNRNIPTTHIELDESNKPRNVGINKTSKKTTKCTASRHNNYNIAVQNYSKYFYRIDIYFNITVVLVECLKPPGRSKRESPKRSRKGNSLTGDINISGDNEDNIDKKGRGNFHYDLQIYRWNKCKEFTSGIIEMNFCNGCMEYLFTVLNLL